MLSTELPLEKKCEQLSTLLSSYQSVMIAFSGGVDSTFLLQYANKRASCRVVAAIGESPSLPRRELEDATTFLKTNNIEYIIIKTEELSDHRYNSNPENRCYFCKSHLFNGLSAAADEYEIEVIADGTNADDLKGHRPGKLAGDERGVISPLADCGFSKAEIRQLSKEMKLSTYSKPAMACLASRFPQGVAINQKRLSQVEKAEDLLAELGFSQFRVRFHDEGRVARIELAQTEIERALQPPYRQKISEGLKSLGFNYISIDLDGYRTGSLSSM